jgi:hypothetical protein
MRKSRKPWRYVAVFVLGAALIPASGCSSDIMTIAYYVFSTLTSVVESTLTDTTS